jgi:hypothetical protein
VNLAFGVLGDSVAYGQGATRPSDTVGACLAAELTASGIPTELCVFAVSGAYSAAVPGAADVIGGHPCHLFAAAR